MERERDDLDLSIGNEENSIADDDTSKGSFKEAREDILVLLTVTMISADTVFVMTTIAEEGNFREGFKEASDQLVRGFFENIDRNLWVARTLSKDISSAAASVEWPFVTISNFDDRCEGPIYLSKASLITLNPFITREKLRAWQDYIDVVYHMTNSVSGVPTAGSDSVNRFRTERRVEEGLYRFENGTAISIVDDPYLPWFIPMWQVSPSLGNESDGIIGTLFEESSNSVRERALQAMILRKGSAITSFLFHDAGSTDFANYSSPRSSLYYPVFGENAELVATVDMEFKWEAFLENAVDDIFDHALLAVVESSCGDGKFMFNVTGPRAIYARPGGQTVMEYTPVVVGFEQFATAFDYHGEIPFNRLGCSFKITVHPSPEFQESYSTSRPDIFRAIALGGFLLIVAVFVVYDTMVEKRQNRVVQAAVRSDAIVRSIFPSNVRDRLYADAKRKDEQRNIDTKKGIFIDTQKNRIKRFMDDGEDAGRVDPIADLFPKTTVLFADIAGFTGTFLTYWTIGSCMQNLILFHLVRSMELRAGTWTSVYSS
jgi:hypothetical protein